MLNNAPNVVELREHCPGSAGLAEGQPKSASTPEKEKGIRLHAAIDNVLTGRMSWQAAALASGFAVADPADAFDIGTIQTAERVYGNEILRLEAELDAEAIAVLAEQPVDLTAAGWNGMARLDFVVLFADGSGATVAALVVELKTGLMLVSGPEANRQLHDYLVGAATRYTDVQHFYGAIFQPAVVAECQWRMGRWTRAEVLEGFGATVDSGVDAPGLAQQLTAIREATHNPNAPLAWGDHCSTCVLKEMCPARRGTIQEARAILAESGSTVAAYMAAKAPAERLTEWKTVKEAARYLKKFDELVKAWILNDPENNTVPGFRVMVGKGDRVFDPEIPAPAVAEKAWSLAGVELEAAGFAGPHALLQTISPVKVEDALDKVTFGKLEAAGLVVRPDGGLKVVEDKAPAIPKPRKKG